MTRKSMIVAAVLSTLYEVEKDSKIKTPIPASTIYMALGMDMMAWEEAAAALRRLDVCDISANTIELTDKGRQWGKVFSELESA